MADPEDQPPARGDPPPPALEPPPGWRQRLAASRARLLKPLVAVAAVGTVLSGLVGYWNVYRTVRGEPAATHGGGVPLAAKSLAVLPFANLGDAADRMFADGLTSELLGLLSRTPGLRVTAECSAFRFRDRGTAPAEIGRQLGVNYLIEGTVQRAAERIRVSTRLVEARSGAVLSSRSFERSAGGVLQAQTELALQIAAALQVPLDAATLAGSGTGSAEAWTLYRQAREVSLRQPEDFRRAEAMHRRALELDPRFARPHLGLAMLALAESPQDGSVGAEAMRSQRRALHARMRVELETALRLDPGYANAHAALALAANLVEDTAGYAAHVRRALELDPSNPTARRSAALLAMADGRMDEAIAESTRGFEVSPGCSAGEHATLLRLANRPQVALTAAETGLLLEPEGVFTWYAKSEALLDLGRRDDALQLARRALARMAADREPWLLPAFVIGRAGTPHDQAEVERLPMDPLMRGLYELTRGRPDAVLRELSSTRPWDLAEKAYYLFDPMFDPVREEPAFRGWLARNGLVEAHARAAAWRRANPSPS